MKVIWKGEGEDRKAVKIVRNNVEVMEAWRLMRPWRMAGYVLMPLTAARLPRDAGWQDAPYDDFDVPGWLRQGGNIGIRLTARDLVVDVDKHTGKADGAQAFEVLCLDAGVDLDKNCPITLSGGGGRHLFYAKDELDHTRVVPMSGKRDAAGKALPSYPGIDFKRGPGAYVVAPGSYHPTGGSLYLPYGLIRPDQVPQAPEGLLRLIRRTDPLTTRTGKGGEITCEELATLLDALDATAYGEGNYMGWIAISAAAFDGTNGEGFPEWAAWCRTDPAHENEDEAYLELKWWSFEAGRDGGATYKKLLWAVVQAGRKDLVAKLGDSFSVGDDFPDDDAEFDLHAAHAEAAFEDEDPFE